MYKDLQTKITLFLLNKLEENELSISYVSRVAKYVLKNLPTNIYETEVEQFIKKLVTIFPKLNELQTTLVIEIEEKEKQKVLKRIEELLATNKTSEAIGLLAK